MTGLNRIFFAALVIASCAATSAKGNLLPQDLVLSTIDISVARPLAARHAGDGSGRLFITDRGGRILIYDSDLGALNTPFLDISSDVDTLREGGLLGLAFHPDYESNGFFYVSYTRSGINGNALESIVERFQVSAADPNVADRSARLEIFTLDQPEGNHNGGDIHFGPDGLLYIGLGDGGGSSTTSQDPSNLLGKMLRIDPCATEECEAPYSLPSASIPSRGGLRGEIWALGFRNPYRWSFDRETGDLFVADVGASAREEVSFEPVESEGGLNYGWNCREGDIGGPGGCNGDFVEPILTYPHTEGDCSSITGGFRYRGCIQDLRGTYIYADFCSAKIFFATEKSPGAWSASEWGTAADSVFGFGEDEAGELYVLSRGNVSRFESESGCSETPLFKDGFEQ